MARPKKTVKAKEPVRIRFKELKNGNKSIYLDIYRDGKRTYEFLKLYIVPELDPASRALNEHNLALANKVKADRIIQLTNNEKGVTNSMLHSRMKLIDLINMYEQWIKDNGKSMGSSGLASLRKAVTQFRGDGVTLKQVDKTYCIEFINYLRNDYKSRMKRPLSTNSIASYSAALSATFNWAVRHDYIKENPFDKLSSNDRVYHVESQRDYLEIDELKRLIATECPTRQSVKQAFLFSCYCGLRTSDIRALRWGQIHKDGDQWRVSVVMKKTARPIYLPLSSQAMKWLPERGDASDDDKVFSLPTTSRVSIILGNWAKAANVKKEITFHVSRHTFATLMLTLDVDLYTTSKLLGHKNIATTQIYAKIIDQKKDDAVNFYSVQLDEEELSELEKFFEKFPEGSEYDHDIDTIIAWLDRIGESGALERYFRYEGRFGDGVSAIPVETSNLRLYCIRLSDKILVFGNGGVKDCATWQESETLAEYVEMLVDTSRFISSRLSNGTLYIVDKEIIGNLNFTRDEKK